MDGTFGHFWNFHFFQSLSKAALRTAYVTFNSRFDTEASLDLLSDHLMPLCTWKYISNIGSYKPTLVPITFSFVSGGKTF